MENLTKVKDYIERGLVLVQNHPSSELLILNYSPKVQYERLWDDVTMQCRGLIVDKDFNIIEKPFTKFFNLEEVEGFLPNEPFEVFEKMDGSLGILYWIGNEPFIASRGSFASDHAKVGTRILHTKYKETWARLDKGYTYLFEIIFPENRIVVNYGDTEDLVLLTAINKTNGSECLPDIGFPMVARYPATDFKALKALNTPNKEGFVVRFKSGMRIKIKFEEYVRLHYILTNLSEKVILDSMIAGEELELDRIPDEYYEWVKQVKAKYLDEFNTTFLAYDLIFKGIMRNFTTRKEFATEAKNFKHPGLLFAMLDGKDTTEMVWKIVKQSCF